jgi:hypothetical protein
MATFRPGLFGGGAPRRLQPMGNQMAPSIEEMRAQTLAQMRAGQAAYSTADVSLAEAAIAAQLKPNSVRGCRRGSNREDDQMRMNLIWLAGVLFLTTSHSYAEQGCATDALGRVVCAAPGGGAATDALGRVVTGAGQCERNSLGSVECARTPGGGAATDGLGRVLTGPGQCVQDGLGRVQCSSKPGGGAAVDGLGRAVCAGGCVAGH